MLWLLTVLVLAVAFVISAGIAFGLWGVEKRNDHGYPVTRRKHKK